MQRTLEPKPLRHASDWMSYDAFKKSEPTAQGLSILEERSKVVCRDCFGFGHSKQTCPTSIKLDNLRETNLLAKSAVGKIRARIPINFVDAQRRATWPMMDEFDKWLVSTLTDMNSKVTNADAKTIVTNQLEALSLSFKQMKGKICLQCSGWGHLKDDWAKSGRGMSKNYCHTTKYNDIVFANHIGNK